MREITFEMAQSLGLIPMPRNRYLTIDFPFESREAKLDREAVGEEGYRNDVGRLRRKYATVWLEGEKLKVI